MYKSPIETFQTGIEYQLENDIMNMIQKYGITVDKDELLKALRYDRDQYDKGYADGKVAAIDELIRCKDCIYRDGTEDTCGNIYCRLHDGRFDKDGYCSYGGRESKQ
jgi:hypothetical protein